MKKISYELLFRSDEALAAKKPGANNHTQMEQLKKMLVDVIQNELTPRQQEILDMYYYRNMTEVQIAQQLGVHKSTVCRTKQRGLKTIHRFLKYHNFR